MTAETEVASFVVRFVYDEEQAQPSHWHGLIRHIQSDETITFTNWAEAVNFIQKFVPMELNAEAGASDVTGL